MLAERDDEAMKHGTIHYGHLTVALKGLQAAEEKVRSSRPESKAWEAFVSRGPVMLTQRNEKCQVQTEVMHTAVEDLIQTRM